MMAPNGMKSGAGDDPFADDVNEVEEGQADTKQKDRQEKTAEPDREAHAGPQPDVPEPSTGTLPGVPEHPGDADSTLPWIHRRNGVKDDRTHKTIHYTEHTVKRERRDLLPRVEDVLGEDVELTDVREAAYLIGMNHVDEVADQLREWGYDIE